MDVTVAVATYGEDRWRQLAADRAIPSAVAENVPVVYAHRETLARARNHALGKVETEFVVHLDADDELTPGYVAALAAGSADLRAPAVQYVRGRRTFAPRMPRVAGHHHDCSADCLPEGNWLIVGSAVRAQLARAVGGWNEYPWSEDWDLWLRCWRAGATIEAVPKAVYRAHVDPQSRNRAPDRAFREKAHWDIHRANFGDAPVAA